MGSYKVRRYKDGRLRGRDKSLDPDSIAAAAFISLYVDERMSMAKIASRMGQPVSWVRGRLKHLGVRLRGKVSNG